MVQYQHLYLDGKAIRGKQSRMQQLKEKMYKVGQTLFYCYVFLKLHKDSTERPVLDV